MQMILSKGGHHNGQHLSMLQITTTNTTCSLYYNRATSVATIVIQISYRVLGNKISYLSLWNVLAYSVYDRSYNRSLVIVQATGFAF